ncbi:MAG: hypothetical protein HY881_04570 [Deltaproteobacteria bacterium]|nr:hypothetical protein [Deltaproteobacteria bacterium]
MSISGISSSVNTYQTNQATSFDKIKKDFETLGTALKSGNLDDAKKAYAQLQKDSPTQNGTGTNPMSADIDTLGKALDSGDLKAAQEAYAKIQEKISQGPPAGGRGGGTGGAQKASASSAGSQSDSKVYDEKDINKDGTVSYEEEMAYALEHPEGASQSQQNQQGSGNLNSLVGNIVDIKA